MRDKDQAYGEFSPITGGDYGRRPAKHLKDRLRASEAAQDEPEGVRAECLVCALDLREDDTYLGYKICPRCRFHYSMSAGERVESLVDPNSFREINRSLISLDPLSFASVKSYNSRIFQDQQQNRTDRGGRSLARPLSPGTRVMLIVLDFGFMGGTMGCAVGEKIALTLERATKTGTAHRGHNHQRRRLASRRGRCLSCRWPRRPSPPTGSTRPGIPLITVLANPATGQAYGSFANLADIILAEPGAIVGFSSLRVIERASDLPLPFESHTAESHLRHGNARRGSPADRVARGPGRSSRPSGNKVQAVQLQTKA